MKKKYILLVVVVVCLVFQAVAVSQEVYQNPFSKNSITIRLSSNEVSQARRGGWFSFLQLGDRTARKVLRLTGIPESVTGKVAGSTVWGILVLKYAWDISNLTKNLDLEDNQYIAISYYGVDIEMVRNIWSSSQYGDELMPGSEATKQVVMLINTLINTQLH